MIAAISKEQWATPRSLIKKRLCQGEDYTNSGLKHETKKENEVERKHFNVNEKAELCAQKDYGFAFNVNNHSQKKNMKIELSNWYL